SDWIWTAVYYTHVDVAPAILDRLRQAQEADTYEPAVTARSLLRSSTLIEHMDRKQQAAVRNWRLIDHLLEHRSALTDSGCWRIYVPAPLRMELMTLLHEGGGHF